MNALRKSLSRVPFNFYCYPKYSSTSLNNLVHPFEFKSNFTNEEKSKILDVLNTSSPDELSKFKLSQARIKNLQSWKTKKGPFRTLGEVLEVDGLGEKVLEKVCENIKNNIANLGNESTESSAVRSVDSRAVSKKLKPVLVPVLGGNISNSIKLAVGVHLSPTGISWATLSRSDKSLVEWNYENYSSLLPKKMFLNDTFDLAIHMLNKIPPADIYVFENNSTSPPAGNMPAVAVSAYTQHLELLSMLVALINTSAKHNVSLQKLDSREDPLETMENRVFYLRAKVPARMFKTLVGTEKVAAESAISELLENPKEPSLPCTQIKVNELLKNSFHTEEPQNKELLGQALMLIVSFMDLCIYRNPKSLASLVPGRRNK